MLSSLQTAHFLGAQGKNRDVHHLCGAPTFARTATARGVLAPAPWGSEDRRTAGESEELTDDPQLGTMEVIIGPAFDAWCDWSHVGLVGAREWKGRLRSRRLDLVGLNK